MPGSITDMLNDPEFKALPKATQEQLITEKTFEGGTSEQPRGLKSVGLLTGTPHDEGTVTPGSFRDMFKRNAEASNTPQSRRALDTGFGALTASTLPGMTPGTAGFAGALSGAFPPKSTGERAMMGATGALPMGSMMNKLKDAPPAIKTMIQSLLGGAMTQGYTAGTEGINRGVNALGGHEPTGSAHAGALETLLGMFIPGAAQHFTGNAVTKAPATKGANLLAQLTGDVNPSALESAGTLNPNQTLTPSTDALQHGNPAEQLAFMQQQLSKSSKTQAQIATQTAEQVLQAKQEIATKKLEDQARELAATQRKAPVVKGQQQMDQELSASKLKTAQMKYDQARAEMRGTAYPVPPDYYQTQAKAGTNLQRTQEEVRAERMKQRKMEMRAQEKQIMLDKEREKIGSPLPPSVSDIQAQGTVQIAKENEYQASIKKAMEDLQQKASSYADMNPGVRDLVWRPREGSGRLTPTIDDIIQNVVEKGTADDVRGIRDHLAAQGKGHVEAFEKAMTEEFMRRAYDGNTRNLTNAPKLAASTGPFSSDKLAALYGVQIDSPKITEFRRAIDDIGQIRTGITGSFARSVVGHGAWVTAGALITPGGLSTAKTGLAIGAGLVSIGWPKLIDEILRNPRFGQQFHQWATSTTRMGQSLKNWPRLAAQLHEMSEPVSPTTGEMLMQQLNKPPTPPPMPQQQPQQQQVFQPQMPPQQQQPPQGMPQPGQGQQ